MANDIILKSKSGVKKYPKTYTRNIIDLNTYKPKGVEYSISGVVQENQLKFYRCTKSEYESLSPKDDDTLYMITPYSITPTLSNVTASIDNPTYINDGESVELTFTANEGYVLPSSVVVVGATSEWDKASGTLTLSNPTSNVTFSIIGEEFVGIKVNLVGDFAETSSTWGDDATTGLYVIYNGTTYIDEYYSKDVVDFICQPGETITIVISAGSNRTNSLFINGVVVASCDYSNTDYNFVVPEGISEITIWAPDEVTYA